MRESTAYYISTDPADALFFHPEEESPKSLKITNISSAQVAFKVRLNNPLHYSISPRQALLGPWEATVVRIQLKVDHSVVEESKDLFKILAKPTEDLKTVDWSSEDKQQVVLEVVIAKKFQPAPPPEKPKEEIIYTRAIIDELNAKSREVQSEINELKVKIASIHHKRQFREANGVQARSPSGYTYYHLVASLVVGLLLALLVK